MGRRCFGLGHRRRQRALLVNGRRIHSLELKVYCPALRKWNILYCLDCSLLIVASVVGIFIKLGYS